VTLKFQPLELMFRSWYYFRLGYAQYLNFFLGFFMFVSTTYYLAILNLPFLREIFPHFYVFVILGIVVIAPLGVLIGWFHMKRTLAYSTEATVSVESNPYTFIVIPGKEEELWAPAWMLTVQALQKILEKENMLSAEEKSEFEAILARFKKLLRGEVIGEPKQRQMLAKSKREKELIQKAR